MTDFPLIAVEIMDRTGLARIICRFLRWRMRVQPAEVTKAASQALA
jgi:hypothetical protein